MKLLVMSESLLQVFVPSILLYPALQAVQLSAVIVHLSHWLSQGLKVAGAGSKK
jgi:hypothetical protein